MKVHHFFSRHQAECMPSGPLLGLWTSFRSHVEEIRVANQRVYAKHALEAALWMKFTPLLFFFSTRTSFCCSSGETMRCREFISNGENLPAIAIRGTQALVKFLSGGDMATNTRRSHQAPETAELCCLSAFPGPYLCQRHGTTLFPELFLTLLSREISANHWFCFLSQLPL